MVSWTFLDEIRRWRVARGLPPDLPLDPNQPPPMPLLARPQATSEPMPIETGRARSGPGYSATDFPAPPQPAGPGFLQQAGQLGSGALAGLRAEGAKSPIQQWKDIGAFGANLLNPMEWSRQFAEMSPAMQAATILTGGMAGITPSLAEAGAGLRAATKVGTTAAKEVSPAVRRLATEQGGFARIPGKPQAAGAARKATAGVPKGDFYVYRQDLKTWEVVPDAKIVKFPDYPEHEFFVHANADPKAGSAHKFIVSESKTGAAIGHGGTSAIAKAAALRDMNRAGTQVMNDTINRITAQIGVSPRLKGLFQSPITYEVGDKVFAIYPGLGGIPSRIEGVLYKSKTGLRVRITSAEAGGARTQELSPRWKKPTPEITPEVPAVAPAQQVRQAPVAAGQAEMPVTKPVLEGVRYGQPVGTSAKIDELTWAKGALSTHLLAEGNRAASAPRLTPKNYQAAIRILRAAKDDAEAQGLLGGIKADAAARAEGFRLARQRIIEGKPVVTKPIAETAPAGVQPPIAKPMEPVAPTTAAPTEAVTPPTAAERTPPPVAAAPPIKPPVESRPVGTTGAVPPAGAVPKGSTPIIQGHLAQAKAIVDRDAPGTLTRVLDYLPGPKQVQRGLHPSLGMTRKVLEPWVAEGNVLGTVGTRLSEARIPVINQLKQVFGEGVVKGTEKSNIRFLGTPAEAKYPATGSFYDIAQNPHLYDLSPVERSAIEESETTFSRLFDQIRSEYAIDIGKFPNRPGSMFLSNIEKPEAGTGMFETAVRTAKSGRAKERFYQTGRERWAHDVAQGVAKPYDPVLDVEQLIGGEMHDSLTKMAGRSVYKAGLGGLNRMETLEATGHESLVKKMVGLRTRLQNLQAAKGRLNDKQQIAITDFLASPLEDADLTMLHQGLEPTIGKGRNVGMDVADITKEITGIRAQITALQPAWKTANTKGYQFVQEGIFKYFPDADAQQIRRLAEVSNNPLLRWVDNLRATAFGGDLSPVTIQMSVAWLSDPIGVSAAIAKRGARGAMFTEEGMLASLKADPAGWQRFIKGTGLNPLGGVDKEFAVGFLGMIPKVGKFWTEFNETVYRPVMRLTKDIFDNSYAAALKRGLSEEQAIAIAADDATKIIPRYSYRRLGQSQAEAARYRAVLTSVSFLTQPTALMADATKGLVKIGLKQTITPSEHFAVRRVLKIVAITSALAVSTSVAYAIKKGQDPKQAALNALNPTHSDFMAVTTPWGAKVGLGGPYRSLIRAVVPRDVPGIPVPVPFAGIYRFGMSKLGPTLRSLYEVAPGVNRNYQGKLIRKHDSVPLDILRSLEHVLAGNAPLTAGSSYETLRQGKGLAAVGEEALSQFAGTNYIPFDAIWDAKIRWDKDLKTYRDIPSNDITAKRESKTTREDYRTTNPEVDAKLFITGQVDSVKTTVAFEAAVRLMKENGISVKDIPSLTFKKDETPTRKDGRERFQRALGETIQPSEALTDTGFRWPWQRSASATMGEDRLQELMRQYGIQEPTPVGAGR